MRLRLRGTVEIAGLICALWLPTQAVAQSSNTQMVAEVMPRAVCLVPDRPPVLRSRIVFDLPMPPAPVQGAEPILIVATVSIDAAGQIQAVQITQSHGPAYFGRHVEQEIRRQRFAPACRGGVPDAGLYTLSVRVETS